MNDTVKRETMKYDVVIVGAGSSRSWNCNKVKTTKL